MELSLGQQQTATNGITMKTQNHCVSLETWNPPLPALKSAPTTPWKWNIVSSSNNKRIGRGHGQEEQGKGKSCLFLVALFFSLSFSPAASLPLGSWPFWLFLLWFSLQHFVRARSLAIFVLRQGSRSRIPKRMQLRPASSSVSVDLCQRIVVCNAAEFTFTPY